MLAFMFLLRRFSKYIIYIVLVINVRCINTINNDIHTDDVNNSVVNKNTPSLIIKFRINDNITIFNFSEVVNSNFFFEKRRCLKFYINGIEVSKIEDEFISWSYKNLLRDNLNVNRKKIKVDDDLEISELGYDFIYQISNDILDSVEYNNEFICNRGLNKYQFSLKMLYRDGFNLLEVKDKNCNYFSDFFRCDLSYMFFGCTALHDLQFYLQGIDKIKIGNYTNILSGYDDEMITETGFKDICDFSKYKKFLKYFYKELSNEDFHKKLSNEYFYKELSKEDFYAKLSKEDLKISK